MNVKYITIEKHEEIELVEKKSRFIANIYPVSNLEEIENIIEDIKKLYRDATHNVYGYRLIDGTVKYSDDGEPSGTAGMPILKILKSNELQNVLVVVTRYFGGTLLGTGGLVRAYSESCKRVIDEVKKIEMIFCSLYKITTEYNYFDIIQHYCKENDFKIKDTKFSDNISIYMVIPTSKETRFLKEINNIINKNGLIELVGNDYFP